MYSPSNPGRCSVQATSQFNSSGRPQSNWVISLSLLAESSPGVPVWRVMAKKMANWSISALDTSMHVEGWAIQESLMACGIIAI